MSQAGILKKAVFDIQEKAGCNMFMGLGFGLCNHLVPYMASFKLTIEVWNHTSINEA